MRSWVEIHRISYSRNMFRSTSSWGRELKYSVSDSDTLSISRPLREVVSWNSKAFSTCRSTTCRPLREVVSWNMIWLSAEMKTLKSTSSWGRELKYYLGLYSLQQFCRPLREVVSWNDYDKFATALVKASTSSWGRELKCLKLTIFLMRCARSTSSWGRELK